MYSQERENSSGLITISGSPLLFECPNAPTWVGINAGRLRGWAYFVTCGFLHGWQFLPAMVTDVVGHCLSPSRDVYEKVEQLLKIEVRDLLVTFMKKSKN